MRPSAEPLLRFVIGGAQKGGTSALARYLDAHPALCLPTETGPEKGLVGAALHVVESDPS